MASILTTEEKLLWLEGYKAIEKLINRRSFLDLIKQGDGRWQEFWCSDDKKPTLGVNDGFYTGLSSIGAYYEARRDLTAKKTELVKLANPALAGKTVEELFGIGQMTVQNLTSQVIETARDNKTAKGIWYYTTFDFDLSDKGPEIRQYWGRIGIDFIREGDDWKIWHVMDALDFEALAGTNWTEPEPQRQVIPAYASLAECTLPEPDVKLVNHEKFWRRRPVIPFPAVPQPYDTFAETFSYGM